MIMTQNKPHTILRLAAALAMILATTLNVGAEEVPGDQSAATLAPPLSSKPFPAPSVLGPPALAGPNTPPPTAEIQAPAFQIKLGISGEEKATDNALTATTATKADLITTITPSVGLSYLTRTLDLSANYDLGYDRYAFNTGLDGFRHNGLGVADIDLIEHVLSVDSRFSDTEEDINPTGPATADNRTTPTNQTRVITFSTKPQLERRLGSWAVGQISYRHDETHYQTPATTTAMLKGNTPAANLADSRADTGTLEVRSGEAFSRLVWDFSSDISRQLQGVQVLKQNTQDLGAEYRITGTIGLLAEVGYDQIRGDQVDSGALSGVFYSGGLHWTPSPDSDLRAGWGKRNGSGNLYILGEHKFSPMTSLRVSNKVNITTDAMSAIEALYAVQRDPNGAYLDPFSGSAANPSASAFARSNAVYRQSISSAVLSHTDHRETISVMGSLAKQTVVGGLAPGQTTIPGTTEGTASTTLSLGLEWAHRLTPASTVILSGSKDDVIDSNAPTGNSQRYRAGLGWSYQINTQLSAYASYRFVDSEPQIGAGTKENLLIVGLTKHF